MTSLFIEENEAVHTGTISGNEANLSASASPAPAGLTDSLFRMAGLFGFAAAAGITFVHGQHRSEVWLSGEMKKQKMRFNGHSPEAVLGQAAQATAAFEKSEKAQKESEAKAAKDKATAEKAKKEVKTVEKAKKPVAVK